MASRIKRIGLALSFAFIVCLFAGHPVYPKGEVPGQSHLSILGVDLLREPVPSPELTLSNLEGDRVSVSSFKGRFLVLHFWTTWSPTASADLDNLGKLQKALADRPFAVITVAVDPTGKPPVEGFLKEHPAAVPVFLDPQGEALKLYAIRVVPTSILIDERGYVIGRVVGSRQWDLPASIKALKKIVKGSGHYGIITSGLPVKPSERSR